ncbi:MAG: glycerate kinase [Actinomycetia bacterium]|nr:glycerate kinase [Actinomycetes bacterium]
MLIAPDKFKGTLSAAAVATHVSAGLRAAAPEAETVALPIADGGEGTLDAAVAAGFRRLPVTATGPNGRPVAAAIAARGGTAVVELAAASGLALAGDRLDPLGATSRGAGELIRAALDTGAREIVLGVGGSACTDGGAGLLQALGARLLDRDGADLPAGGGPLSELARVELGGLDRRLADTRVVSASDVDNPLLGPHGAAAVYGPQKGADAATVERLEAGLRRLAELIDPSAVDAPGAGAAGGVGYAALTALGAIRRPGVAVVLELVGFADALPGAELVITGEGRLDDQTGRGKAPAGVAAAARAAGVPVVAVCGQCVLAADALAALGIAAVHALTDIEPELSRCLAAPGPLLRRLGRRIGSRWLAKAVQSPQ